MLVGFDYSSVKEILYVVVYQAFIFSGCVS